MTAKNKSALEKAANKLAHLGKMEGGKFKVLSQSGIHYFLERNGRLFVQDSAGLTDLEESANEEVSIQRGVLEYLAKAERGGYDAPPAILKGNGKDFEELYLKEAKRLAKMGILGAHRYGTQASFFDAGEAAGGFGARASASHPDFDNAIGGGFQFIVEAKVCSASSFELRKAKLKEKQVRVMLNRAKLSVDCYLLIHFNQRSLKTIYGPAETWAIPVKPEEPMWQAYLDDPMKNTTSISRQRAREMGRMVRWHTPRRHRVSVPDLANMVGVDGSGDECRGDIAIGNGCGVCRRCWRQLTQLVRDAEKSQIWGGRHFERDMGRIRAAAINFLNP